jgi:uncharacterized protein (TIGR02246 family)
MRILGRVIASAVLLTAMAWLQPAAAADKVREAVERTNRAFLAAYAAHDSAKIATLYARDGAALPPGSERADGRDAIQKVWQGAMDAGITNVAIRTEEVEAHGAFAFEGGVYALDIPGKDGKLAHATGKYIVVWKRTGGVWQLYRDIWNDTPLH